MKTYAELEREAYIAGNIILAKLYAELEDVELELEQFDELIVSREYGGT